jgi:hypothetical protein
LQLYIAPTTPPTSPKGREYNTIKRARFFYAYDNKNDIVSLKEIASRPNINIPRSTARTWLKKRDMLRDLTIRRIRRTGNTLGRKSKVSTLDLKYYIN